MTSCTSSSLNSCFGSSSLIFLFFGDFGALRPFASLRGDDCSKTGNKCEHFRMLQKYVDKKLTISVIYRHCRELARELSNGSTSRAVVCTGHHTSYICADDRFYALSCGSLDSSFSGSDDYRNHKDKAETLCIRPDRLVMAHRGLDQFDLYVQFGRQVFQLCKHLDSLGKVVFIECVVTVK